MTLQQIKDAAERVDSLQKNLHTAEEYIAALNFPATALHTLDVGTTMTDGVDEHECPEFDEALAEVVKSHFPDLAREALARMTQAYHSALIAEKDHLKGALEEVERAEELAATNNPFSEVNQKGCNPAHADA